MFPPGFFTHSLDFGFVEPSFVLRFVQIPYFSPDLIGAFHSFSSFHPRNHDVYINNTHTIWDWRGNDS